MALSHRRQRGADAKARGMAAIRALAGGALPAILRRGACRSDGPGGRAARSKAGRDASPRCPRPARRVASSCARLARSRGTLGGGGGRASRGLGRRGTSASAPGTVEASGAVGRSRGPRTSSEGRPSIRPLKRRDSHGAVSMVDLGISVASAVELAKDAADIILQNRREGEPHRRGDRRGGGSRSAGDRADGARCKRTRAVSEGRMRQCGTCYGASLLSCS